MRLTVDGRSVLISGVRTGRPVVVFLHGAGMDRSIWASQTRAFGGRGWDALAVDLPGHGGSAGPALGDIGAMADWTLALLTAAGSERAALVGHSMGALIALEAAARAPERVTRLALVGVAAKMPVHPDLLAAAEANRLGGDRYGEPLEPRRGRARRLADARRLDARRRAALD